MKSKFATQPRSFWPLQCGEALAFAKAWCHPAIPPHSRSRAERADRRAGLRMRTCGQPHSAAMALNMASALRTSSRSSSPGDKEALASSSLMVPDGLSERRSGVWRTTFGGVVNVVRG